MELQDLLDNTDLDYENIPSSKEQKGAGSHTLCPKCNNDTGSWYGGSFVQWSYQAMRILRYTSAKPSLIYPFQIFPLRVFKQIICLFMSANGPDFRDQHPSLEAFVLNKEKRFLNDNIKIFTYYNPTRIGRQSGVVTKMDFSTFTSNTFAEVSFPPLGYIMTIDSTPPDDRVVDISFFQEYFYKNWRTINLQLPAHHISTFIPSDFRSKSTIRAERVRYLDEFDS